MRKLFVVAVIAIIASLAATISAAEPVPLKLLFLGDSGHHQPAARFAQLAPVLKERGIELTYTDKLADLNRENLGKYAGLVIYANHTSIKPEQETALLDYVSGGKGLIALHCASACFGNSAKYIELVGAQFQRHGTGTFRTILANGEAGHAILRGFGGFESWDETYVHTRHNDKDRTILEWRSEAGKKEPWTWVRTPGQGRVFYTAWGHDLRTWGNAGFQNLVERGIRWAVGADPAAVPAFRDATADDSPAMTAKRTDVKPFEYKTAHVPFYPPGGARKGDGEWNKMQQPLAPAESQKHYVTPVGFEMRLFATEPDLGGKPIAMTWDERGRLWVAETVDYPNELQPPGKGRDRIRICEDTDGDGRADKFTVFADKLSIPTSLLPVRSGLVVHAAPDTLFLRDTNGDDVADERHVLFTGWGTRDTHAGPSNLRYGLDNWIYGIVGYSGFSGTVAEEKLQFGQGFYRFWLGAGSPPKVEKLEFLRSMGNNSWGVGFSEEGLLFGSTANGNPSVFLAIPNRYYESVRGWSASVLPTIADSNQFHAVTENVRQVDWHGGFTAAAGHALYTARTYPKEYWNRTAFVCEPTGHLVATFTLTKEGAGFRSRNAWNLAASDDEWSAPVVAEVGPDGNVWISDWYNFIVQHNPTPAGFENGPGNAYETNLRDKKHGRIYRLVFMGQASRLPSKPADMAGGTPAPREASQLVALLKSDNMFWRLTAQRLLIERGKTDVVPDLQAIVKDQSVDEIGLNAPAMHALWTLAGLGGLDVDTTAQALKHPSAGVRRSAAQIFESSPQPLAIRLESVTHILQSGIHKDRDSQVRLEGLLALSRVFPAREAAEGALEALADPVVQADATLLDATTSAAAAHGELFLTAAANSQAKSLSSPVALERIAIVAGHVARGEVADPRPILAALQSAQPAIAEATIIGLVRGWPRGRKPQLTPELESTLSELFAKLPPTAKSQLVSLALRWGSQELGKRVAEISAGFMADAQKEELDDTARLTAANQYVDLLKADPAAGKLLDLITPRTSPELARGLVEALGRSESEEIGQALAARLGKLTPAVRIAALRVLLSRGDWTAALLDAIQSQSVPLADLSLDQKQALASHPDKRIADRAKKLLAAGGGLPNPDRQKVLDELLPLTEQTGDPAAGKLVFKNQCAKCHVHSGEGAKIGPDLTGMAVHPKKELLVHLLDPSRGVEGNFRVYTVLTADGVVLSGLLASETKTSIELIDSEAKRHIVLRDDIENLQASPKSLMPEGFEKQVKPQEIVDLLEFLTQRGRFVPLDLSKVATISSLRGMFYDENAAAERLVFADWGPKTFAGVPFQLVDPREGKAANVILLHGPQGKLPPNMPKSVSLPCHGPAKAIHLLSGVAGWAYPLGQKGSVSLIVRLVYADRQIEDHPLKNGEHFADYIRHVDVPGSQFAYDLAGRQLRYLTVSPARGEPLAAIELVKGEDRTAPVVMAVTVESR
ncbi:MAG: ThuA domain-containing protein [Pirellulaceae bacterium]|nr:ThuA domain-containing protein [Pirellulaceae bacterium]